MVGWERGRVIRYAARRGWTIAARSLAEPEPDRQVFAKCKHSLRKAAARSAETICVTIGEILRAFTPTERANYFRNSGYAQS
jgi:hypothetical protein